MLKAFGLFFFLMSLSLWSQEFQVEKYKGKVVYLDFWASWCAPCQKSFSWMNKINNKFKSQGLEVVAINLDSEKKLAEEFLVKNKAEFQVLFDQDAKNTKNYNIIAMPTSFLIDRNGNIKKTNVGFKESELAAMEQEISKLIQEK